SLTSSQPLPFPCYCCLGPSEVIQQTEQVEVYERNKEIRQEKARRFVRLRDSRGPLSVNPGLRPAAARPPPLSCSAPKPARSPEFAGRSPASCAPPSTALSSAAGPTSCEPLPLPRRCRRS